MKIAMIGQRGIPASYGGIDLHVEQTGLRLAEKKHQVTIFCRTNLYPARKKEFRGIKLVYLPAIRVRVLETVSHSLICSLYVIFRKYDVIHLQGLGAAIFSIMFKVLRRKTVVTIHCMDWQKKKWGFAVRQALKICEWAAINFPDRTIVVSKTLQKYYAERYGKRLVYIPNGADNYSTVQADVTFKRGERLADFGLKEDDYILFLGRLVPEKGCHYLIKAFRQIKTDKKLAIVGGSSYTEKYIKSLKSMAEDDMRIIFTGPVYGAAKDKLIKGAYIFILPSEVEGLSVTLFEVMSFGKCALVSDISENMEAVGDCGFTFESRSESNLMERLSRLLSESDSVRSTGERAKSYVKQNYSWQAITGRLEELYESIGNGSK